MIPVEAAISRVRRDITLGVLLKAALIATVIACLVFAPQFRVMAMTGIIGVWLALSIHSARSSRIAHDSPNLIAAGQFDEAERQIDLAMRAFSVFGPAKLRTLHQLAVLRHAQRRWEDAAQLCRALLGQKLSAARSLTKPAQLILAESLLEMNDLQGSYGAISELYAQQLSLEEVLNVLALQLDYESKLGAWSRMFAGATMKVQMAELMPSSAAGRVQALLALAAKKCDRLDWADWLRQRAELLVDVSELTRDRPLLSELWQAV